MLRWDDFENDYFAQMERTGIVKSMKDFYWDIRPKPEYGTIELRVCDTPLTVERAAALAGYLQALCRHLLDAREPPRWKTTTWSTTTTASRPAASAWTAAITHPKTYESMSLREDILATLRKMEPHAEALGSRAALRAPGGSGHEGSDASYLRRQYERQGSAEGMVDAAIRVFRLGGSLAPR